MGLRELAQQALHGATGVPRLYGAALRAGTGPAGALEVLRISEAAMRAAATHGAGVPGRTNAVRHFVWQALLAGRFDRRVAEALAAAQEADSPNRRDSEVDEHNNLVGQDYGATHTALLRPGSLGDAVALLVPVALEKWDAGELIWVRQR